MGDIKPFDQDSMEWCFFRDFYKMCRKNWHRDGRDITEMCCEITGLAYMVFLKFKTLAMPALVLLDSPLKRLIMARSWKRQ